MKTFELRSQPRLPHPEFPEVSLQHLTYAFRRFMGQAALSQHMSTIFSLSVKYLLHKTYKLNESGKCAQAIMKLSCLSSWSGAGGAFLKIDPALIRMQSRCAVGTTYKLTF